MLNQPNPLLRTIASIFFYFFYLYARDSASIIEKIIMLPVIVGGVIFLDIVRLKFMKNS
jgi:hypothetical protein